MLNRLMLLSPSNRFCTSAACSRTFATGASRPDLPPCYTSAAAPRAPLDIMWGRFPCGEDHLGVLLARECRAALAEPSEAAAAFGESSAGNELHAAVRARSSPAGAAAPLGLLMHPKARGILC